MRSRKRLDWISAAFVATMALLTLGVAVARPFDRSAKPRAGRSAVQIEHVPEMQSAQNASSPKLATRSRSGSRSAPAKTRK